MNRLTDSLAIGAMILAIGALIITYQLDTQYQKDQKEQREFNAMILNFANGTAIPRGMEIIHRK